MAGEAISTGLASPQILTEEEQVVVAALVASRPRVVTAVVRPRVEEGDTLPGQVPPHPPLSRPTSSLPWGRPPSAAEVLDG